MQDTEYAKQLHIKLTNANIPFGGVGQNGIVYDVDGKTEIQKRPDIAAIIAQGIVDPLENARGKHVSQLSVPALNALLAEICDRLGIADEGIIK